MREPTATALLALLDNYCGFTTRGYRNATVFLVAALLIALNAPEAITSCVWRAMRSNVSASSTAMKRSDSRHWRLCWAD